MCVNNLPGLHSAARGGRDSNPRPVDRKSGSLTTEPHDIDTVVMARHRMLTRGITKYIGGCLSLLRRKMYKCIYDNIFSRIFLFLWLLS